MTLKIVEHVDLAAINTTEVQVIVSPEKNGVMLFREDYCEDDSVCFSRVDLTRADVERLLEILS